MNTHVRPLYEANLSDTQSAIRFLADDWNAAWERAEREAERRAGARQRIADWIEHALRCRERSHGYRHDAAQFPVGSRDHEYYRARAQEQWDKAHSAIRWAKRERASL